MKNYTIAKFPFTTSSDTGNMERCSTVRETMLTIVKQFLKTPKKVRLAKNVGSSLPEMLLNIYNNQNLISQANLIKQELIEQFPEFTFLSLKMRIENLDERSTLIVTIEMTTNLTEIFEFELFFPRG